MVFGIVQLYCGKSGEKGFYNNQEIGLARALRKFGCRTVIIYPKTDIAARQEEQIEADIRIVYVPAKAIGVHARYDWKVLVEYGIQAAQIGSDNQLFAPSLVKFCDRHHIPIYNYVGTTQSDTNNPLKRQIMNMLYQRNCRMLKKYACFAKTEYIRKALMRLGVTHARVVPVGLDTSIIPAVTEDVDRIKEELNIPKGKKIILFVGRIDEYKRPLDAFRLFQKLDDGYYLVMIGTGKLDDQLELLLCHARDLERINWIKKISNEKIHLYYAVSDYFINLNKNEIFGMSILEAMYQGCTAVVHHAPGPDSIIENGCSGYLVDSDEEMLQVILQGQHLDGKKVRERVEKNFLWDTSAEIIYEWLKEICFDEDDLGSK